MEEYGTVKSIKIKEVRTERKKRRWFVFQWKRKQKKAITEIKCMKTAMEKYLEFCIINTAVPKF